MHVTDVSHVSYQKVFRFDSIEGKKKLGEDRYLSVLANVSHARKNKKSSDHCSSILYVTLDIRFDFYIDILVPRNLVQNCSLNSPHLHPNTF